MNVSSSFFSVSLCFGSSSFFYVVLISTHLHFRGSFNFLNSFHFEIVSISNAGSNFKQAGAELGQAQLELGQGFTSAINS